MSVRFGKEVQEVLRKNGVSRLLGLGVIIASFVTLQCRSGLSPGNPVSHPTPDETSVPVVSFPARIYGGAVTARISTGQENSLLSALRQKSGVRCEQDFRLAAVARDHAEALIKDVSAIGNGQIDYLRFLLRRRGGTDYAIEPVITTLDPKGRAFLEGILAKQRDKWSHCGLGLASDDRTSLVVWIGVDRAVALDPVPVSPNPETTVAISGRRIHSPAGDIVLYLGRPGGTVMKLTPGTVTGEGGFTFVIPVGESGRYDLELLHDTGHGLETVVLLPLYAGTAPPSRPTVTPDTTDDDGRSEEEVLLAYLNAARKKVGLKELTPDSRLERVAAAHTADMVAAGFFGHVSPSRGALSERLAQANLSPEKSAENIASSTSLYRIHRNLMDSPAHRINMVDPGFTHVGIGVAHRGDKLVATQIYASW